jgi:Ca-activated chloride channel family protein
VVAVYPREGTFWSDHPVGIVERDWVGPAEREAAKLYIDYLLQEPQQRKALTYGFRPGLEKVKLDSPIDKAHGVDPEQPARVLTTPSVEVMRACLRSWKQNKKHARVILVLDRSGSMNDDDKLINARKGCFNIIEALGDGDTMGILTFSDDLKWVSKGQTLRDKQDRAVLVEALKKVRADGETALYDAVAEAHRHLQETKKAGEITAIVVLTDGDDNKSRLKLDELLKEVQYDPRRGTETRIYTIAYGSSGANVKALEAIARATKATASEGQPETIKKVILKIITFF